MDCADNIMCPAFNLERECTAQQDPGLVKRVSQVLQTRNASDIVRMHRRPVPGEQVAPLVERALNQAHTLLNRKQPSFFMLALLRAKAQVPRACIRIAGG